MVAALFAGNLTIKPATTPLMRRFGIRNVLLVNGIASVGCFGLLAALRPGLPIVVIAGDSLRQRRAAVHRLHRVLQSGVLRHRG